MLRIKNFCMVISNWDWDWLILKTRSDILQGQALFRGVKQLRKKRNFHTISAILNQYFFSCWLLWYHEYLLSRQILRPTLTIHDLQSASARLKIVRRKLARKFRVALKLTDMILFCLLNNQLRLLSQFLSHDF